MSYSMNQPQIVFGLGTGRCGTTSLAHLLNHQRKAMVFHEIHGYRLAWSDSEDRIERFLSWAMQQSRYELVGDVAFAYLPYVSHFLHLEPAIHFVCLQRDRAATLNSYLRFTKARKHWMQRDRPTSFGSRWHQCFPKYDAVSKVEAIGYFWDDYYSTARDLERVYAGSFRIFATQTLNTEEGQRSILEFAGISPEDIRCKLPLCFNQGRVVTTRSFLISRISKLLSVRRLWVKLNLPNIRSDEVSVR